MDETMLTARKRLKVLAKKGQLPLVPEQIKLLHMTGCITVSASGYVFKPLIILPNKKTLRTLDNFLNDAHFASSSAGWIIHDIFTYYCLLLICELSCYRLTLPKDIRNERLIHYTYPRRRPFMTQQHIQARLNFCDDQLQNEINWENGVVFRDESRFCLRDDSRRIWIKRGV